jgi:hypothetical protein
MREWTGDICFHLYEERLVSLAECNHVGRTV